MASSAVIVFANVRLFEKLRNDLSLLPKAIAVGCVAAVLCILYFALKSYPMDYVDGALVVDPAEMKEDGYAAAGATLGALIGALVGVIGGPVGDSGLTGRKIIVDTYGGAAAHGGGAFSGKDPTKVDRSAAYAARYIAKNIVAAGLADKAEIQLAYAIGVASPVSILVNTFGTGKISDALIKQAVEHTIDLRPSGIIERFDLKRPIYAQTASYGHFGRTDIDLPWERTDLADELKSYLAHHFKEAV